MAPWAPREPSVGGDRDAAINHILVLGFILQALRSRKSPGGPKDPSFRALSGRLKLTVRRHKFNEDSLSQGLGCEVWNVCVGFGARKGNVGVMGSGLVFRRDDSHLVCTSRLETQGHSEDLHPEF